MKSIAKEYCDSVKKQMMVYFANWEPSMPLKLGDYGAIEGNIFTRIGNIKEKDKDIKFTIHTENNRSHKRLTSTDGVKCKFNPQTKINVAGQEELLNANIDIKFTKENSFFLNASGCVTSFIENKSKLGQEVKKLLANKNWDKEYVIVTDIVEAEKTTIAISSSGSSSILFEAKSPLIEQINLADTSLDLRIKNEEAIGYSIHTSDKLIPLIGLCGMRPKFFAQAKFKPIIKKFPTIVSSFLHATDKASNSATTSAISLDNVENSLTKFKNDLGFKSGIQYISNDLENGAVFEIENMGNDDSDEAIKIEGVLDEEDLELINKITSEIEVKIEQGEEATIIDISDIKGDESDEFNFSQLI